MVTSVKCYKTVTLAESQVNATVCKVARRTHVLAPEEWPARQEIIKKHIEMSCLGFTNKTE